MCVCYHSVVSDSIRINVADAFRCAAETNLNLESSYTPIERQRYGSLLSVQSFWDPFPFPTEIWIFSSLSLLSLIKYIPFPEVSRPSVLCSRRNP